jgi:hypothetical protein
MIFQAEKSKTKNKMVLLRIEQFGKIPERSKR